MLSRLTGLLLLLILSACATAQAPTDEGVEAPSPIVVLISIDGFRPDYLERGLTPTLSRLAAEGVSGAMRPSFPSKTFPNHYTLVTGLRPDRHGVVNNTMTDADIPGVVFRLSNKDAVSDRRWWDDAEPIWVTAQNAGLTAAAMFWPGSEAQVRGVRPRWWLPYDEDMSAEARVDQLLLWLTGDDQADFATLYFEAVDTAGHTFGPDSAEVNGAVAGVDAAIGRLVEGVRARGIDDRVVLLIVSDHGMAATSPDRVVRLGPVVSSDAATVLYTGATVAIEPAPGREAEVAAEVLAPRDHLQCWRKGDLPERLQFGHHRRAPGFFCLAETGWLALKPNAQVRRAGGDHGYDNAAPDMQALFIAHGPGIASGRKIEGLDNVDIHPLIGRLLNLPVPAGDGDVRASDQVLASRQ